MRPLDNESLFRLINSVDYCPAVVRGIEAAHIEAGGRLPDWYMDVAGRDLFESFFGRGQR